MRENEKTPNKRYDSIYCWWKRYYLTNDLFGNSPLSHLHSPKDVLFSQGMGATLLPKLNIQQNLVCTSICKKYYHLTPVPIGDKDFHSPPLTFLIPFTPLPQLSSCSRSPPQSVCIVPRLLFSASWRQQYANEVFVASGKHTVS